nr:hypothetical protein Iba_chr13fCG6290 [Ipomoea batatas]
MKITKLTSRAKPSELENNLYGAAEPAADPEKPEPEVKGRLNEGSTLPTAPEPPTGSDAGPASLAAPDKKLPRTLVRPSHALRPYLATKIQPRGPGRIYPLQSPPTLGGLAREEALHPAYENKRNRRPREKNPPSPANPLWHAPEHGYVQPSVSRDHSEGSSEQAVTL